MLLVVAHADAVADVVVVADIVVAMRTWLLQDAARNDDDDE